MKHLNRLSLALAAALGMTAGASAQQPQQTPPVSPPPEPAMEPNAIEILKAMNVQLAAVKASSFTALSTYEPPAVASPSTYTTISQVTLQRPDKLRVIPPGDGPRRDSITTARA
jgi:hypothetical protein